MAFLRVFADSWAKRGRGGQSAIWGVIALLSLLAATSLPAQSAVPAEYQVKAVFLFNFAQFVDWPPKAFVQPQAPLIIGILGGDPFGTYLDETVRGEKVNNHPLVVQRYRRVEDIKTCHVLFISGSEANQLEQILELLKGRNILTVGDTAGFASNGGIIQFATEKNKIRLKINLQAAKAAQLTISSKLLRPAEIVGGG